MASRRAPWRNGCLLHGFLQPGARSHAGSLERPGRDRWVRLARVRHLPAAGHHALHLGTAADPAKARSAFR